MPGPIPKRDSERTRRNKTNEAGLTTKRGIAYPVGEWPEPSPHWVPPVVRMYESFQTSGMVEFFQDTDVSLVWVACEGLQAWYEGGRRSANQFQFVTSLLGSLGASEGERRRMRIELELEQETDTEESAALAAITDIRSRLMGA